MEVMSREEVGVHRGYRFFLSPTTGQRLALVFQEDSSHYCLKVNSDLFS